MDILLNKKIDLLFISIISLKLYYYIYKMSFKDNISEYIELNLDDIFNENGYIEPHFKNNYDSNIQRHSKSQRNSRK